MGVETDNMYAVPLEEAWELFGGFLSGPRSAAVLVASCGALPDAARTALDSSFQRLGWGACTYLAWPRDLDDPTALFMAVEGLDPCVLVVADGQMARLCEEAFRQKPPFLKAFRLNCRDCCAFQDFAALLDSPEHKQRAWAALKTLPKRQ